MLPAANFDHRAISVLIPGSGLVTGDAANPAEYSDDFELNQINNRLIRRMLYPARSYRLQSRAGEDLERWQPTQTEHPTEPAESIS